MDLVVWGSGMVAGLVCLGLGLAVWRDMRPVTKLPDAVRSPVAEIQPGTLPRWEVEATLAHLRVRLHRLFPGEAAKFGQLFDTTRVIFMSPDDPNIRARSWGVYQAGQLVRCSPARGWRGRLCLALAHAFRLRLRGDGDALRTDRTWFAAFSASEAPGEEKSDASQS